MGFTDKQIMDIKITISEFWSKNLTVSEFLGLILSNSGLRGASD